MNSDNIAQFYNSLSPAGRRVIAALIGSAPLSDLPADNRPQEVSAFPFVITKLRRRADCCKLSVLRNLDRAEKQGLLSRKVNSRGQRYGSLITLQTDECARFMELYEQDFHAPADTGPARLPHTDATGTARYPGCKAENSCGTSISDGTRLDPDDPVDNLLLRLSDQGKRIMDIICRGFADNPDSELPLFIQHTALQANCGEATARRVLNQGHEAGIFEKRQHERGPRFGIILSPDQEKTERVRALLAEFPPPPVTEAERIQQAVTVADRHTERLDTVFHTADERYRDTAHERIAEIGADPLPAMAAIGSPQCPETMAARYPGDDLLDRQIEKYLSANQQEEENSRILLSFDADDFQAHWPKLQQKGFGPDQIRQIVQHRLARNETVRDVENSLYAAEWELDQGSFPDTRKGVCNYLFATLRKKGSWRRPPGFLTPAEQALANARKDRETLRELKELEIHRQEQAEKERLDEEFEKWLAGCSEQELETIDGSITLPLTTDTARRGWRKCWWSKNVRKG